MLTLVLAARVWCNVRMRVRWCRGVAAALLHVERRGLGVQDYATRFSVVKGLVCCFLYYRVRLRLLLAGDGDRPMECRFW